MTDPMRAANQNLELTAITLIRLAANATKEEPTADQMQDVLSRFAENPVAALALAARVAQLAAVPFMTVATYQGTTPDAVIDALVMDRLTSYGKEGENTA